MIRIIASLIIATGLIGSGFLISQKIGLEDKKAQRKSINLTGVSSKKIKANRGETKISFSSAHNDLKTMNEDIEKKQKIIINFLRDIGFKEDEILLSKEISILDKKTASSGFPPTTEERYIRNAFITVKTNNINLLKSLTEEKATYLTEKDISASLETSYQFNGKVDSLEGEMIKEAMEDVFSTAKRFSEKSGIKVGPIHSISLSVPNNSWWTYGGVNKTDEQEVQVSVYVDFDLSNKND